MDVVTPTPSAPSAAGTDTGTSATAPVETIAAVTPVQTTEPTPQSWVEQRSSWAKGDEKALAWASRYSSTGAVLDALKAANTKISEGVAPKIPGVDASPEAVSAWRAANNVPAAFTDYEIELPEGVDLNEEGEGIFSGFLEAAHKQHVPQPAVNAMLGYLLERHVTEVATEEKADVEAEANTKATLRQEWGPEAPANYNGISNLIATAPEAIQAGLLDARMPNGARLKDSPEAMRWLANLARETNPMPTVVPNSGMSTVQTLDARIAELAAMSGDRSDDSKYWYGAQAQALQAEFSRLHADKERYAQKPR